MGRNVGFNVEISQFKGQILLFSDKLQFFK